MRSLRVRFEGFELDSARLQLLRAGEPVHLTPKAFRLLAFLIEAAPRVVPKAELHSHLWPNGVVTDETLAGLVKEVRKALVDATRTPPLIRTAYRVGYAFCGSLERLQSRARVLRWLVIGRRRVELSDGENIIGRDPTAVARIDDATVSRRHARITVTDEGTQLEDLGSKNGTTRGGIPVDSGVRLASGDHLACGRVQITYCESPQGPSTLTQLSERRELRSAR
ncbi:MAG TPA: winged helix-turn-helix domain-containing protein [Steroidobacteraceae bacterium]